MKEWARKVRWGMEGEGRGRNIMWGREGERVLEMWKV